MLKYLTILAVLAAALFPTPGKAVESSAQGADKSESQGNKASTAPSLPLVNKPIQPGASDPYGGIVAAEDKEHSVKLTSLAPVALSDKPKSFWGHVLDWGPWIFNLGLVIVGGFQIWLLKRTWKTVQRQTVLQEASMTQWVDMLPSGIRVETKSKSDPPDRVTINLHWKIVNNTSYPFTLPRVETTVCRVRDWDVFGTNPDEVIAPKGEAGHNFYVFFVPLELTKSQTTDFFDTGIALSIAT